MENKEETINSVHSEIHDYPIDYEKYPLAKECVEQEFVVKTGEFIIIPSGWHHWIFTEPNTLAISYTIHSINIIDLSNVFYENIENSTPYVGKIDNHYNITYDKFFKESQKLSCLAMYSQTYQCCPVYKDYKHITFNYYSTLEDIIDISNRQKLYTYVGMDLITDENILKDYNKIENFMDSKIYDEIKYETYMWFTLNNRVDSGLHYDGTCNILYVLDGKKTVKLFHPKYRPNLYIRDYKYMNYYKRLTPNTEESSSASSLGQ